MKASLTFPAAQRRRIQIAQVFNTLFSDAACLAVIAARKIKKIGNSFGDSEFYRNFVVRNSTVVSLSRRATVKGSDIHRAFFMSIHKTATAVISKQPQLFGETLYCFATGYGSRFSVCNAKQYKAMKTSLTLPAAQRRRFQIAQVFSTLFSDAACLAVIAAFTCAMFLHICAADDMLQLQNSIGRDLALAFPWIAVLAVRTSIRLFREGGER